ncbi:MAG: YkgJ family cysteine cluster protein [Desulfuromonadales bacterium]|nr:YkgJ family cysteine cluster protein [Desulfuromonadales bacterium]
MISPKTTEAGGNTGLQLTNFSFGEFQDKVAAITGTALRAGDRCAGLAQLFSLTDRLLQTNLADDDAIACGPGCGACCVVNVAVLYPEALLVANHIDSIEEQESRHRVRETVSELAAAIRWLDSEERLLLHKPCAFLTFDATCSIHPSRPLLCRSVNSVSADDCRAATVVTTLGPPPLIITNLFQKQLYETAFAGVAQGLEAEQRPTCSGKLAIVLDAFLAVTAAQRTPEVFVNSCRY